MNPKILSWWLVLFISLFCQNQMFGQTFFYKQVKTILNGKPSAGDNSVIFVTFNLKGCYDSDKDGISVNNGFLSYIGSNGKIKSYHGNSYWGWAYYYLLADYSRLNIKFEDSNKILVYIKSHPTNEYTCSFIKEKSNNKNNFSPIIVSSPNMIDNLSSPNNIQIRGQLVKVICAFCKGIGLNPACDYAPDYTGGNASLYYCNICKKYREYHSHGSCPSCLGKGYTERYITN